MKDSPLISVLMAVHNGERFVREALDSILGQTYTSFEVICIDDASTDRTLSILRSYDDPRINILQNNTRCGLTQSLNRGLLAAEGVYVARMDADDVALPSRLHEEKLFLDTRPDIVCVGSGTIVIDEQGRETGRKRCITDPELLRFRMVLANPLAHPTVMFRKAEVLASGGYNLDFPYSQDYELWSRLTWNGYRLSNIDAPLLRYRFHAQSITQGTASRERAYACAVAIIRENVRRYILPSEQTFTTFLQSFHKHTVRTLPDMLTIIRFLRQLTLAYVRIEHPSTDTRRAIYAYTRREQVTAVRWYLRYRFHSIYTLIAAGVHYWRKSFL